MTTNNNNYTKFTLSRLKPLETSNGAVIVPTASLCNSIDYKETTPSKISVKECSSYSNCNLAWWLNAISAGIIVLILVFWLLNIKNKSQNNTSTTKSKKQ